MPAQGMPLIIVCWPVVVVSCGQTYAAIAIPEVRIVMTRKTAIKRKNDGNFCRISSELVREISVASRFYPNQATPSLIDFGYAHERGAAACLS